MKEFSTNHFSRHSRVWFAENDQLIDETIHDQRIFKVWKMDSQTWKGANIFLEKIFIYREIFSPNKQALESERV